MSYLVLARKFRPQTFKEVVGQQPIVRTLQNAFTQKRVPHAVIFSGVRGTGKTTIARIMAKALNCEQGPGPEPCNACRSCKEIAEGSSIDLQEVDGASNRGIQEIRELKEKIRFMPTSSRYKIIIIDEVHMLTTEAFNALLKTLEEPPDHVFFMFATTELHKVPVTILSRCQRYELKRIKHGDLVIHFRNLAQVEGVKIEDQALDMIAREAEGSVRDGLSLLDQVFSYCGQEVRAVEVIDLLGLVNVQAVANLGKALLASDLAAAFAVFQDMYSHGIDLKRLTNDLLSWFRSLIVFKIGNQGDNLPDIAEDDLAVFEEIAGKYSLQTLSCVFNLLLETLEKALGSSQPRLGIELAFIRVVQAGDVLPVTQLIAKFDQVLSGVPLDKLYHGKPASSVTPGTVREESVEKKNEQQGGEVAVGQIRKSGGATDKPTVELVAEPEEQDSEERESAEPVAAPVVTGSRLEGDGEKTETVVEEQASSVGKRTTTKDIRSQWPAFLDYIHDRIPWMAAALRRASSTERVKDELVISFEDSADCSLLKNKEYLSPLTEFALDFFQESFSVRFEVPDGQACEVNPQNGKVPQQERKALANDPLVLTALEIFNGQVGDIRIGPRFRKKLKVEEEGVVGEAEAL